MSGTRSLADQIDELKIELATQRLITRSIVAFLILKHEAPMRDLARAFSQAAERMSAENVPIDDLDPELHRRAAALAAKRTLQMLSNLGPLVVPRRRPNSAA